MSMHNVIVVRISTDNTLIDTDYTVAGRVMIHCTPVYGYLLSFIFLEPKPNPGYQPHDWPRTCSRSSLHKPIMLLCIFLVTTERVTLCVRTAREKSNRKSDEMARERNAHNADRRENRWATHVLSRVVTTTMIIGWSRWMYTGILAHRPSCDGCTAAVPKRFAY